MEVADSVAEKSKDNDNTQLGEALGAGLTVAAAENDKLGVRITATAPVDNCVIGPTLMDHLYTRNYGGISGAMEYDGFLLLTKQLQVRYNDEIWFEYIITDNDTKMRKYIFHLAYRPRRSKNIEGSLPIDILDPN